MLTKKILKAQKHQAKGYNRRYSSGTTFKVGMKVLTWNLRYDKRIGGKLQFRYLGLYSIVDWCTNGNFKLKDKFSHLCKKSIPPGQLIQFYEDKLYTVNKKGQFECSEDMVPNSTQEEMSSVPNSTQEDISSDSDSQMESDYVSTCCERAHVYKSQSNQNHITSTPIKSQTVIVSSQEMPLSSDDSETIDVVGLDNPRNPFSDMDVNDIPIEIVDNLNDKSDVTVTKVDPPPVCLFTPISDQDCVKAALKFSFVINPTSHPVRFVGVGEKMSDPPTVTDSACGNGACLFNSLLMLLSGRDTYSAIIRHVICNYISNPVKHKFYPVTKQRRILSSAKTCTHSVHGVQRWKS